MPSKHSKTNGDSPSVVVPPAGPLPQGYTGEVAVTSPKTGADIPTTIEETMMPQFPGPMPTVAQGGPAQGARAAPHIMVLPGKHDELAATIPRTAQPTGFDYPMTLRGSTAHFHVYYDPAMGANGQAIADGVLAVCEADYQTVSSWFGVAPGPYNVLIHAGIPGAYHYGCSATDLYCDAHISPNDPNWTNFLVIAEETEVDMAVQGAGWNCGASNGEGLSRVLAETLYPYELDGFNSAASWLDAPGRPDFVNTTDPTDRNYVSIGCSVLFLFWLRYQLGFTWNQICAAGASTLAQTYTNLTGRTDALAQFKALLQAKFPEGTPSGLTVDNPFPIRRMTNGTYMIQGIFGRVGNFEMVVPLHHGGLAHFYRNNDDPAMPWYGPFTFAAGQNFVGPVSLIQSNFGTPGNLEVLARSGDQLCHFWRDSGPGFIWSGAFSVSHGIAGAPSLIQSRFGSVGNFEAVVPLAAGGLGHFWRDNDNPSLPWYGPTQFGQSGGSYETATLIESNYGYPGNLEVIARAGNRLDFFWRDSGPSFTWNGPFTIARGVSGNPCFTQGRFGNRGNFEMVVPLDSGGLAHFWRNNDDPAMPWYGPYAFGASAGVFDTVAMTESNYGWPGNLEVVGLSGCQLVFFWRDSGPAFSWNGPYPVATNI